jgi:TatD DNase family protein
LFVDSHCHLDCIDLAEFGGSFDTLIQKSIEAGVEHMLCVSIDLEKYPQMLELVANYPQVSVSVGVHPMADKEQTFDAGHLKKLAAYNKVVAIGETGLDYYYHKDNKQWQQERFRTHMQCAVEINKPVIVHTRDAGQDTLDILKSENVEQCGGVIHCFTETMEFSQKAMELGMMISFSGITTFNNAKALREVARAVPDEHLLIETDSPYLAPVPYRGKQNWPSLVSCVAEKLADVRGTTVEHIAEVTRNNYYKLFGNN